MPELCRLFLNFVNNFGIYIFHWHPYFSVTACLRNEILSLSSAKIIAYADQVGNPALDAQDDNDNHMAGMDVWA